MSKQYESQTEDQPRELERVLAALRRRLPLIGLCVIATTVAAVGFSLLQQKEYTASASLLFRDPGFAQDLFGGSAIEQSPDATREAATNVKLVGLDVMSLRTGRRLNMKPQEVQDMVSVSGDGLADVVTISATDPDPARAKLVANTFARQFVAFRAAADRSKLLRAKNLADRQFESLPEAEREGPRGEALNRAAEKLGILASLQTGNAEIVQPAELPDSPSSPKPVRNGVIGLVLGLLLGLVLGLLLERLNRSLRTAEEVQEAFRLPVLATIPESKALEVAGSGAELPFAEAESFRMLRASLRYFNVDRSLRSVLVISNAPAAGKSTVAWNLARTAAASADVVVLETDLRRPSLAAQRGIAARPGLSELLTAQATLDEVVRPVQGPGAAEGEEAHRFDAIVAGAIPPNPAELLESKAMDDVLARLTERYDLVVIDTPPIGIVADAFPLVGKVDGVVVVSRLGRADRDHAQALRDRLDRLDAPLLGVVANGVKVRRSGYGYGGGYGYGQGYEPARNGSEQVAEPTAERL